MRGEVFVVTQVYNNIYKNEIPLPNNPLKALNSYIIVSQHRNLIIDTGFDILPCRQALFQGIQDLNIDLTNTDLVVTHMHPDHSGLAAELGSKGVNVYMGKTDGDFLNMAANQDFRKNFKLLRDILGFGESGLSAMGKGFETSALKTLDFIPLIEGDKIALGDYSFEIVDIPGHSPGHIGLYERNHKLFFGGDHILEQITPNITFWGFEQDILAVYFNSLNKVYDYEIDFLFPAHRSLIRDHKRRINELLAHHLERLNEITEIIRNHKKTPIETASQMHWDLSYENWEEFPDPQKWFASGEAISHLEHLVHIGVAERIHSDGKLYYGLNSK